MLTFSGPSTTSHPPMLIPLLEFIATLASGLFAGAALYINVAEHPSRMGLETRMAALQWAPSYKRATWLQASLAILSLLCGVAVWFPRPRLGLAGRRRCAVHVDAVVYLWLLASKS